MGFADRFIKEKDPVKKLKEQAGNLLSKKAQSDQNTFQKGFKDGDENLFKNLTDLLNIELSYLKARNKDKLLDGEFIPTEHIEELIKSISSLEKFLEIIKTTEIGNHKTFSDAIINEINKIGKDKGLGEENKTPDLILQKIIEDIQKNTSEILQYTPGLNKIFLPEFFNLDDEAKKIIKGLKKEREINAKENVASGKWVKKLKEIVNKERNDGGISH